MIDPLGGILCLIFGLAKDVVNKHTPVKMPPKPKPTHPEPHRDPKSGKIVIENCKLYYSDVREYGAYQAQQWVKEGKYNLTPEELKKEEERIKAEYDKLHKL